MGTQEIKAGTDLDALVSERVMGVQFPRYGLFIDQCAEEDADMIGTYATREEAETEARELRDTFVGEVLVIRTVFAPEYSTSIEAALEAGREAGIFAWQGLFADGETDSWVIGLRHPVTGAMEDVIARGETPAHAICLAALKAVGEL